MKTKRKNKINLLLFFIVAVSVMLLSCKKDEPDKKFTLDDITLTLQPVNAPFSPKKMSENNGYFWTQIAGNNIFFINASNLGVSNPQFMLKYDIAKNSYSEVTPHETVCACGFVNRLMTDGKDLYYIASEAFKYTVETDKWTKLNYPESAHDNNGETAQAYLNGKIYIAGGRTKANTFKYYDIAANDWFTVPALPSALSEGESIAAGNTVYLFGGEDVPTKLSIFDTVTNSWAEKPENPINVNTSATRNYLAITKDRFIFYLSNSYEKTISIYDTKTGEWKLNTLDLGYNADYAGISLLKGSDETLYITSHSANKGFMIYKVNVEYKE